MQTEVAVAKMGGNTCPPPLLSAEQDTLSHDHVLGAGEMDWRIGGGCDPISGRDLPDLIILIAEGFLSSQVNMERKLFLEGMMLETHCN